MKFTKKMMAALFIIIIIGALVGCSGLLGWILPMTIEERIVAFTLSINSEERSPTEILLNFGPSKDMEQYDNAKKDSYWDAAFPAQNDYTFTIANDADLEASPVDGYLTITVNGTITTSASGVLTTNYAFKMYEEASGNWLINAIYEDPAGTNEMLIKKVKF